MTKFSLKQIIISAFLVVAVAACSSSADRTLTPQRELLTRAKGTIISMVDSEDFPQLRSYIQRARAVLIVPELFKAGFIVGGEYGNAVLLAQTGAGNSSPILRGGPSSSFSPSVTTQQGAAVPSAPIESEPLKPQTFEPNLRVLKSNFGLVMNGTHGSWGNPVFYSLSSGSIGLQIGGQSSETVFVIMTDKGLNAFLNRSFKLGADASIAVGPIGKGIEAATAVARNADIYAFSRAAGLFGGGSIEGSVLSEKAEWNMALYGNQQAPKQILFTTGSSLTEAQELRNILP